MRASALPACTVLLSLAAAGPAVRPPAAEWPAVGRDPGGSRHSPLRQIHRGNVHRLRQAWVFHTGDADPRNKSTIECTPIVAEGVLYVTSVRTTLFALDAATGREKWRFDPYAEPRKYDVRASGGVNRGVAWWSDGREGGERRVLLGAPDGRLISLDARTGHPDPRFGRNGEVDLRAGMERDLRGLNYGPTSAPAIWRDTVILGFSCGEGPESAAPGDVRAFDVRTGREVWRFRTVPRPGEFGSHTWEGEGWRNRGGANAWGGATVDPRRGIVFVGTGSAAFDFYGGDRRGANLFANCVLALDARTGRRIWHYQVIRHDLLDHDLPTPPLLVTVTHDGRRRDAVAQVTKTGHVFVLDRETGEPLFPVREVAAPSSDVPGEQAWPTQPVPVKPPPFALQQVLGPEDLTDISPEARAFALDWFRRLRPGVLFAPPSFQGTLVVPGFLGGATWSGAAFDPGQGLLFVNANNRPNVAALRPAPAASPWPYEFAGYTQFRDREGYPAVRPPWGTLNGIDLNRGEIRWQVTLGRFPELVARGIKPTGTESFGGAISTAGGLVFIGGTMDEQMHAFDSATGRLLWEHPLPAGGYATPCTYEAGGRQFVAIAAGGGGKLGTRSGDAFVAFTLPEPAKQDPRVQLVAGGGRRAEGIATDCGLTEPFAVDEGRDGSLYVVEMDGGERVLRIDRHGVLTRVAGTGEPGDSGDGGPALQARIRGAHHLLVLPSGDVLLADTGNCRIRRIDVRRATIHAFAGTGRRGFSGDGGPAPQAQFGGIYCLALDRRRERLYACDLDNRRVRAIDLRSGIVTTVAGNGSRGVPEDGSLAAQSPLVDPRAVAVDSRGRLYILERGGHALRIVGSDGRIRTVAGTAEAGFAGDGGDARRARLNGPKHLCVDRDDTVLIADTENHAVRRYDPRTGRIHRVAGTGKPGARGIGAPPLDAELNRPHGVFVDSRGTLLIADSSNGRLLAVRR